MADTIIIRKRDSETKVVSLRIENSVLSRIEKICGDTNRSRNEVICQLIIEGLDRALIVD